MLAFSMDLHGVILMMLSDHRMVMAKEQMQQLVNVVVEETYRSMMLSMEDRDPMD